MKRRRPEKAKKRAFPFAALFPELQAEVMRHVPLRTLIEGVACASRGLEEVARRELLERLRAVTPEDRWPAPEAPWRGLQLLAMRARAYWIGGIQQVLRNFLMAAFVYKRGPRTMWLYSPSRHPINAKKVPSDCYWRCKINPDGDCFAVGSWAVHSSFPLVHRALRRVNEALDEVALSQSDEEITFQAISGVLDRILPPILTLLVRSYSEIGFDVTLQCGRWRMGYETGYQSVCLV